MLPGGFLRRIIKRITVCTEMSLVDADAQPTESLFVVASLPGAAMEVEVTERTPAHDARTSTTISNLSHSNRLGKATGFEAAGAGLVV